MDQLNQNNSIGKIIKAWSRFLRKNVLYIPILGAVYISNNRIEKLLFDVLENSKTDKFLPYDKNRRWFNKKMERILLSEIVASDEEIFIPTKDSFRNAIKVYYYSNKFPNDIVIERTRELYMKTKLLHKADNLHFYSFENPKTETKFICNNIYLKKIAQKDNLSELPEGINFFDKLPVKIQQTFKNLGKEPELGGLDFLWKEFISKSKKLNPIICATVKNKIIGSTGYLDIAIDVWGIPFLFPPNLGVIEKMRGIGIGEKLWLSAMSFACQNGAKYTLVQNNSDSPASKFYEKQKLHNANQIYSCLLD